MKQYEQKTFSVLEGCIKCNLNLEKVIGKGTNSSLKRFLASLISLFVSKRRRIVMECYKIHSYEGKVFGPLHLYDKENDYIF